jgi:hypothetical protein
MRKGLSAIIDRTYKGSTHHTRLPILCPNCSTEAAVVVQSEIPDRCGARVWIEAAAVGVAQDTVSTPNTP